MKEASEKVKKERAEEASNVKAAQETPEEKVKIVKVVISGCNLI